MKPIGKDQQVVFVTAEGKEVNGVITEVVSQNPGGGGIAMIDYTERKKDSEGKDIAAKKDQALGHHMAEAVYSEEKKPLTFHFPAEPAAPASSANGSTGGTHK
jgi:hypothetical protein